MDLKTFKSFFNQYYKSIRHFVYYKVGDIELAEDLTQEAFVKFWEKRETIEVETAKSYLYTIANNLAINHIKRQGLLLNFINRAPKKQESSETPQYLMEVAEFDQQLQQAIASLTENQRVVFLMNRIDELTYKEIAERLGLSVKAVEKRMHQALQQLRKAIKQKI